MSMLSFNLCHNFSTPLVHGFPIAIRPFRKKLCSKDDVLFWWYRGSEKKIFKFKRKRCSDHVVCCDGAWMDGDGIWLDGGGIWLNANLLGLGILGNLKLLHSCRDQGIGIWIRSCSWPRSRIRGKTPFFDQ